MLRLFAALPLPDPVAEAVVRTQAKLVGARWSPRENLHITLRFIGDVDERRAQDIDSELGQIRLASFELSLHGAGHFGGDKPHALYLGVAQNDALERLNMACERACRRVGLAPDSRHYTPHATVCYLPRLQTIEPVMAFEARHALFSSHAWVADRFYLYSSVTRVSGPSHYRIEAEYPLLALPLV
jgi:RNA 2',3'-cyclic 3'-phosphodiesterase